MLRDAYADLNRLLAMAHCDDRDDYTAAKGPFVASVLGREVQGDLLSDVGHAEASLDDSGWLEAIRTLLERQVLEERTPGQFRFVHDRLREIAYQRLPEDRRRAMHRRVAEVIEARCERQNDHAIQYRALAHHWTQSGVLPRAIEYLDRAGTQALDTFANREAVAFFQEVILLNEREGGTDPARLARWERSLAEAHLRLGEVAQCREHAQRALTHAGSALPTTTPAWVFGLLWQMLVAVGRAVVPTRRSDGAQPGDALRLEAASSLYRMLEVFLYGDDPLRGVYCGLRNINVAEALPPSPPLARGYAMMSIAVTASPLRSVGRAWAERSLTLAEGLASPGTLAYCLSRAGVSNIQEARWKEAEDVLRRGIELCKSTGDARQMEECCFVLGVCLYYRGTFAESLTLARETTRTATQRKDVQTAWWGRLEQAQALMRLGRAREAMALLVQSLDGVDADASSFETIWTYGLLALASLQAGERVEARTAADKALRHMQRKRPVVYGSQAAVAGVAEVYNALAEAAQGEARAELMARAAEAGGTLALFGDAPSIRTRKRQITARTPQQARYIQLLKEKEMVFGLGPAGTGKTYLAVAAAVDMLMSGQVQRIILSRPAVEAGERLGFLPGDLKDKVDPYLRPLYDALHDMLPGEQVVKRLASGDIEVAPLAFMRGRTLTNAAIILDEAQNTTSMPMKMFLTRLGENSRMLVTGDPSQIDLPNGQTSGLAEATRLLDGVEGIAQVHFKAEDVIRHELVARIVSAYEGQPQRPAAGKP